MTVRQGNSGFAFHFDSSSCTGCKACQIACKDRNGLDAGLLWRRVYEVAGGAWSRRGPAWVADVFAYYLSVACNHCAEPICWEVCPAGAIERRADGIVLLESERCIGCRYCAWSCPYGAPQYDESRGRMTKCSFCAEDLDRGLPPSCVSACPMRALEFGPLEDLLRRFGAEAGVEPYPLPDPVLTRPAHLLRPHRRAEEARSASARIANREEVGG